MVLVSHLSITVICLPPTPGRVKRRIGTGVRAVHLSYSAEQPLSAFLCTSAGRDTYLLVVLFTRVAKLATSAMHIMTADSYYRFFIEIVIGVGMKSISW